MAESNQVNIRLPKNILDEVDKMVDGVKFRSRAQVATVALVEFLRRNGANVSLPDGDGGALGEGEVDLNSPEARKVLAHVVAMYLSLEKEGKLDEWLTKSGAAPSKGGPI